jgi:hypothetical protein
MAASHAAAAQHAVHAGRRVQPQRGQGVRGAPAAEPRGAHRCVSRSQPGGRGRSRIWSRRR